MVFICSFQAMTIDTFLTIGMMLGPSPPECFAGQFLQPFFRFRIWFRKPGDSITADFKSFNLWCLHAYLHQKWLPPKRIPSSNRGLPTLLWAHPHQNNEHPMSTLWILSKVFGDQDKFATKFTRKHARQKRSQIPFSPIAQHTQYQNWIHFVATLNSNKYYITLAITLGLHFPDETSNETENLNAPSLS